MTIATGIFIVVILLFVVIGTLWVWVLLHQDQFLALKLDEDRFPLWQTRPVFTVPKRSPTMHSSPYGAYGVDRRFKDRRVRQSAAHE